MNEKFKKVLVRAGAEVCKFLASWLTAADFSQGALVYGGLTVLQIILGSVMGGFSEGMTAARKAPGWKRILAKL